MRGLRSLLGAALASVLLAPAAPAATPSPWAREAARARAALDRSVRAGYVTPAEAARDRAILAQARAVRDRVPPLRAQVLDTVLAEVARPASPIGPRALELYATLAENAAYLASHRLPAPGADVAGPDGAVYRSFPGVGLQFHPLANASELNQLVADGDTAGASALAAALAARAIPVAGGGAVWEYEFPFGGERGPWTSGMAQAVMAQALARAGWTALARRAFRAIPGALDRELPAGPWIRLYSGRPDVVLNAQLQSAISLGDYAQRAHDAAAAAYANRLLAAAKAMLPRFDTGHWSRYSLGVESDLHYQDYVIELLDTLGRRTGDPAWTAAAARFQRDETQPPAMTAATVTRVVYPRPRDGVRDALVVRFWLSKIAKVALVVDGKAVDGFTWPSGWHTFDWVPATLGVGEHTVRLVAASLSGVPGATDLGAFAVARDTTPPVLAAAKAGGRVFFSAHDTESACCRLRLELRRDGAERTLVLRRPRGAVAVPPGYWLVTVVARDAAGNTATRSVGLVVGQATVKK